MSPRAFHSSLAGLRSGTNICNAIDEVQDEYFSSQLPLDVSHQLLMSWVLLHEVYPIVVVGERDHRSKIEACKPDERIESASTNKPLHHLIRLTLASHFARRSSRATFDGKYVWCSVPRGSIKKSLDQTHRRFQALVVRKRIEHDMLNMTMFRCHDWCRYEQVVKARRQGTI